MRHPPCFALFLLGILTMPSLAAEPATSHFPLRDGDLWVMAGDSITAQHLHSNYFEAFCYARYPKLKFAFRNSGVGGHTIPTTLARFDYDIAAWKPTIVSVELGMNDRGRYTTEQFLANMKTMVERIRSIKARPVLLSASPSNNGENHKRLFFNKRLDEYAIALKDFAAREKIPYADQFHALLDVWSKNKPRENVANALGVLKQASGDNSLAGVEHLRAFLAAQEKSTDKPVSMQGDAVHPGPPGQLMMAAALLKALGAEGFVSSVTLDARGTVSESKGCKVDAVKADGGKLAFDRLDECLPFPIPSQARGVLTLDPTILELSRYTLKVTGLKEGAYQLKINGIAAGKLTASELTAGVNLTAFARREKVDEADPIAAQAKEILNAVAVKEGLVGQWRGISKLASVSKKDDKLKAQLAELNKKVQDADAKIRAAAKPRKLHFELIPASVK